MAAVDGQAAGRRSRAADRSRTIYWALVALVVFLPVPFGAIYPWTWTLMASVTGVLLLCWAVAGAIGGRRAAVGPSLVWPAAIPFALLCLWIVVQMATWSPAAWHHPMWQTAAELTALPAPGRISVDPFDSGSMLMRLLAYGGIFWLALQYGREPRNALRTVQALAIAGLAYAAYGLTVQFTGANMVLWYEKDSYRDVVTSTFRYKNAYATYAGLGALCAVAFLFRRIDEVTEMGLGPRATLHRLASRLAARDWIYVLALMLIVTALLLSGSRAGVVSAALGFLVLLVAVALRPGRHLPFIRSAIVVLAIGLVGMAAFSGRPILDRIGQTEVERDVRSDIYEATRRAIADFPWTGTGAGTFSEVFPAYHPPRLGALVLRAHNSYLENALELGIPGAVLLVLPVAWMAVLCALGAWRRRRDSIYPCLGLAAAALVGVHAAFDFTMQEPAVTATFFLLMGVACAQSWSTRNGQRT